MLFDAHHHAFRVLHGVPRRGIYDNMRTAVDKVGTGKVRQVNARFAAMASHYLFEPEFCNPASGWEKGQVEKNVQDARRRFWQPLPSFSDRDALNAWLEERCIEQWGQIAHCGLPGTIAEVWADEVASLRPPGRPFDGFVEHTKRVSPTCLVHFERNRYSVNASEVRAGLERVDADVDPPFARGRPRRQGSNRHMHLSDLPGYWTQHVGMVMRVIEGDPSRSEVAASTPLQGGGPGGCRTGSYDRRSRVTPAEERTLTSGVLSTLARWG